MLADSYGQECPFQKGLCVERTFDAEDNEVERLFYVRVRFVPTYDARAIFALPRVPADLEPYRAGLKCEVVR